MMVKRLTAFLVIPAVLLAGACDDASKPAQPAGQRAEGEVLGGSISDEMIPLDRLRSQSPPLRIVPEDNRAAPGAEPATEGPAAAAEAPPEGPAPGSAPAEPPPSGPGGED